jgi:hypothetical protein
MIKMNKLLKISAFIGMMALPLLLEAQQSVAVSSLTKPSS